MLGLFAPLIAGLDDRRSSQAKNENGNPGVAIVCPRDAATACSRRTANTTA
jgi:hypothetical protein